MNPSRIEKWVKQNLTCVGVPEGSKQLMMSCSCEIYTRLSEKLGRDLEMLRVCIQWHILVDILSQSKGWGC